MEVFDRIRADLTKDRSQADRLIVGRAGDASSKGDPQKQDTPKSEP